MIWLLTGRRDGSEPRCGGFAPVGTPSPPVGRRTTIEIEGRSRQLVFGRLLPVSRQLFCCSCRGGLSTARSALIFCTSTPSPPLRTIAPKAPRCYSVARATSMCFVISYSVLPMPIGSRATSPVPISTFSAISMAILTTWTALINTSNFWPISSASPIVRCH